MFCPLMSRRDENNIIVDCNEYCGWWNKTDECCAIVTLSNSAINIAEMAVGDRILYTKEV